VTEFLFYGPWWISKNQNLK